MQSAIRQIEPTRLDDRDWLILAKAAELTGTSIRTWRAHAKTEHDAARKGCRQSLAVKKPPPSGKGKRVWWICKSIHPSLMPETTRRAPQPALCTRYPQHKVEAAQRRLRWLQKWRDLCDGSRNRATAVELAERVVTMAKHIEGCCFPISVRALQTWRVAYDRRGPDGLIDRRGYAPAQGKATRSPAAIAFFYSRYRQPKQPTISECHEATVQEAGKRGWEWPPTYSATCYWLNRYDDKITTCFARDGEAVCRQRFPEAFKGGSKRR